MRRTALRVAFAERALKVTVISPPAGTRVPAFGLTLLATSLWSFLCRGSRSVALVRWAAFSLALVLAGDWPTSFGTVHFTAAIVLAGTVSMIVVVGSTTVVVTVVGVTTGGAEGAARTELEAAVVVEVGRGPAAYVDLVEIGLEVQLRAGCCCGRRGRGER